MCTNLGTHSHTLSYMSEHQLFKVGQNAVIRNDKNAVLILRHKKGGKWLLPGGRINKGENWLEGLKREVKEETGIMHFTIDDVLDIDSFPDNGIFCYIVTFLCRAKDKDVKLSEEHDDYAWISNVDELEKYNFWHKDIVKRIKTAFGHHK